MTDEEKKTVVQEVLNQIKTDSQSVDELETVTSLDSVNSLPAMQGEKVVRVPVFLLAKPAEEAAKTANRAAATADASSKAAGTAARQAKTRQMWHRVLRSRPTIRPCLPMTPRQN